MYQCNNTNINPTNTGEIRKRNSPGTREYKQRNPPYKKKYMKRKYTSGKKVKTHKKIHTRGFFF